MNKTVYMSPEERLEMLHALVDLLDSYESEMFKNSLNENNKKKAAWLVDHRAQTQVVLNKVIDMFGFNQAEFSLEQINLLHAAALYSASGSEECQDVSLRLYGMILAEKA